jgi:hypothetical protein
MPDNNLSELPEYTSSSGLAVVSTTSSSTKRTSYKTENFHASDIKEHVRQLIAVEGAKVSCSRAASFIKAQKGAVAQCCDVMLVKLQQLADFSNLFELNISLLESTGSSELYNEVFDSKDVANISVPRFSNTTFSLEHLNLTIANLNAPVGLIVDSSFATTIKNCTGLLGLDVRSVETIKIEQDLEVHGLALLDSDKECLLDANISVAECLAIAAPRVLLQDNSAADPWRIATGRECYIQALMLLQHNTTRIESCGDLELFAPTAINYKLSSMSTNGALRIVLQDARDMQFEVSQNLKYYVFAPDVVTLEIPNSISFNKSISIYAPNCYLVVGGDASAAILEAHNFTAILSGVHVKHGGIFGKECCSIVVSDTIRCGVLSDDRNIPFGAHLTNKANFIASDNLLVLQAASALRFEDSMLQVLDGDAILRTPVLHMTSGKLLVSQNCTFDTYTSNVDVVIYNPPTGQSTRREIPKVSSALNHTHTWVGQAQQVLTPPAEIYVYGVLSVRPEASFNLCGTELYYGALHGNTFPTTIAVQQFLIMRGSNHFRRNWYDWEPNYHLSKPQHVLNLVPIVQCMQDMRLNAAGQDRLAMGRFV